MTFLINYTLDNKVNDYAEIEADNRMAALKSMLVYVLENDLTLTHLDFC